MPKYKDRIEIAILYIDSALSYLDEDNPQRKEIINHDLQAAITALGGDANV